MSFRPDRCKVCRAASDALIASGGRGYGPQYNSSGCFHCDAIRRIRSRITTSSEARFIYNSEIGLKPGEEAFVARYDYQAEYI